MKNFKFPSKFGFELTFVPAKEVEDPESYDSDYVDKMLGYVETKLKKKFPALYVSLENDEGALETNSPVYKGTKKLKKYYKTVFKIAEKFDFTPQSELRYGGGNHVHVNYGFFSKSKAHTKYFAIDLQNRPYLNWMFNEYCDVTSAKPPHTMLIDMVEAIRVDFPLYFLPLLSQIKIWPCLTTYRAKGYALRCDNSNGTVEYRIFDAPQNWKQFYYQILFLSRYLVWVRDRKPKVKVYNPSHLEELIDLDRGVRKFRNLLKKLELNPKDYQFFIDHNYARRKESGYLQEELELWEKTDTLYKTFVLRGD